jgi:hypothetical protein
MPRKKFWQKFGYESLESMIEKKAGACPPPGYRMSGFTPDRRPIYHPRVFAQMVRDGVIDKDGYPIERFQDVMPEPPPYPADDERREDAP